MAGEEQRRQLVADVLLALGRQRLGGDQLVEQGRVRAGPRGPVVDEAVKRRVDLRADPLLLPVELGRNPGRKRDRAEDLRHHLDEAAHRVEDAAAGGARRVDPEERAREHVQRHLVHLRRDVDRLARLPLRRFLLGERQDLGSVRAHGLATEGPLQPRRRMRWLLSSPSAGENRASEGTGQHQLSDFASGILLGVGGQDLMHERRVRDDVDLEERQGMEQDHARRLGRRGSRGAGDVAHHPLRHLLELLDEPARGARRRAAFDLRRRIRDLGAPRHAAAVKPLERACASRSARLAVRVEAGLVAGARRRHRDRRIFPASPEAAGRFPRENEGRHFAGPGLVEKDRGRLDGRESGRVAAAAQHRVGFRASESGDGRQLLSALKPLLGSRRQDQRQRRASRFRRLGRLSDLEKERRHVHPREI